MVTRLGRLYLFALALPAGCFLFQPAEASSDNEPLTVFFVDLDNANALAHVRLGALTDCPGRQCTDTDFSGDCACPYAGGTTLAYQLIAERFGRMPPQQGVVTQYGASGLTRGLEVFAAGGQLEAYIAANIEEVDPARDGVICGVPATERFAFVRQDVGIFRAGDAKIVSTACISHIGRVADQQGRMSNGQSGYDWATSDRTCFMTKDAVDAEIEASISRVTARSEASLSPDLRPSGFAKVVNRGPYWCSFGSGQVSGASSSGSTRP